MRDMQIEITRLTVEITQIHGDDRNHYGQQAHREHVPLPQPHRQQFYDEPSSDENEDYAEGVEMVEIIIGKEIRNLGIVEVKTSEGMVVEVNKTNIG
jgi:hypothetical protein